MITFTAGLAVIGVDLRQMLTEKCQKAPRL
jgi:hypothetical protein